MAKILSGIQPTGDIHLGNYIGALRHWQAEEGNLYPVVDLHSITLPFDPDQLHQNVLHTAALLLALGLGDPSKVFVQSQVPEHTELTWLLNAVAHMGELNRMTQFKSKGRDRKEIPVGLFTYPLLMAADILLYQTQWVPVGEDQKQHLELTRDLAERFNKRYGTVFTIPEPRISQIGGRIVSLRNPHEKMSKSDPDPDAKILLSDSDDVMRRKIMTAVTDSGREVAYDPVDKPGVSNLLVIGSALSETPVEELAARHRTGGYGAFKRAIAEITIEATKPLRTRLGELLANPDEIKRALADGRAHVRPTAQETLRHAKRAMGFRLD